MEAGASVTTDAEVTAVNSVVGTVADFDVFKNVFPDRCVDDHLRLLQHFFGARRRIVDVVRPIVVAEDDVVHRNEDGADFFRRASHFGALETREVAIVSVGRRSDDGVEEEDALLDGDVGLEHVDELLGLHPRRRLRLLKRRHLRVSAGRDDDDIPVWQDGRIIIDVVCHMPNLCPGDGIEAHILGVLREPEDGVRKNQKFLRSGLLAVVVVVDPFRAAAARMPIVVA